MTEEPERRSPNDLLAEQIVADLAETGLISESHKADVESKLKDAGATQDDWNLWVDLATAPETNGEADSE